MKKVIYFGLLFGALFFMFQLDGDAEQLHNMIENESQEIERPHFIPTEEKIKEIIYKKIYITKGIYKGHPIIDKIYFSDDEGNLIKTIDLPKTTYLTLIKSPSKKYLAVNHLCARNVKPDIGDMGEAKFTVYNDEGNVIWHNYGSNFRETFIGANNIIVFAYLHEGYVEFYNISGKYIKTTKISDWTEIPYPEEENMIYPNTAISKNGKYITICRSNSIFNKNKMCELMLIDIEGNIIWKKVDKGKTDQFEGITRGHVNISRTARYIVNQRVDVIFGNPYEGKNAKFELIVELYDLSGQLLWKEVIGKEGIFKSNFTNDEEILKVWTNTGKEYIFNTKSGKNLLQK